MQRFDAGRIKIGGCHACNTCYKTGKPCTFDDDFNTIAPAVLDADAVIFAMPTYWFSVPSNIKGVLDRLYCFLPSGKMEQASGKKAAYDGNCRRKRWTIAQEYGLAISAEWAQAGREIKERHYWRVSSSAIRAFYSSRNFFASSFAVLIS